jgi:hypothetical protein
MYERVNQYFNEDRNEIFYNLSIINNKNNLNKKGISKDKAVIKYYKYKS